MALMSVWGLRDPILMLDLVHLRTLVLLSLSDEVIMNAKLLSNDLSFAELLLSMGDLQGRLQENQVPSDRP